MDSCLGSQPALQKLSNRTTQDARRDETHHGAADARPEATPLACNESGNAAEQRSGNEICAAV